jgi:hypothetical protein
MVTFHSVCGLVWGLGITPEIDISEALSSESESAAETVSSLALQERSGDTKNIIDILKTGPATFSKQRQNWMESGEKTKSNIWASAEDGAAEVSKLLQQQSQAGASSHQVGKQQKLNKTKHIFIEKKKKKKKKNSSIVLVMLDRLRWNMRILR